MAKKRTTVETVLTGSSEGLTPSLNKAAKEVKGFVQSTQKTLDGVQPKSFMDKLAATAKSVRSDQRREGYTALDRVMGRGVGGMAQFGMEAAGFGAIGLGAQLAGDTLAKTGEMLVKIKEGANPAEMIAAWGEGLPVIGGWVKAAESFHELITGSRAEAERMKRALEGGEKIGASNRQIATDLAGHFDPVVHGGMVSEEKMNARLQEARLMEKQFGPKLTNGKDNPDYDPKIYSQVNREIIAARKLGDIEMRDNIRQSQREMNQADLTNRQNLVGQQINIDKLGAKTSAQIWKAQSDSIIHEYNAKYEGLSAQADDLHTQAGDLDKEINDAYGGYREDQLVEMRHRRDTLLKQEQSAREQMLGVGKESDAARNKAREEFQNATLVSREQVRGGLLGASSELVGKLGQFSNSPEIQKTQKLLGTWEFGFGHISQINEFLKNSALNAHQKEGATSLKGAYRSLMEMMTDEKFLSQSEWTPLRLAAAQEGGGGRFSGAAAMALEQDQANRPVSPYEKKALEIMEKIRDNTGAMMDVGQDLNVTAGH